MTTKDKLELIDAMVDSLNLWIAKDCKSVEMFYKAIDSINGLNSLALSLLYK